MPQSLANVLIHLIFSTKNREPFLRDADVRKAMHAYMTGILQKLDSPALIIGGVADHVHILCQLSRTLSVADLVKELKTGSSEWIKSIERPVSLFYWQNGYAVFSVSQSNAEQVRRYIAEQETHHRERTFQDELRAFFRRNQVAFDERYVWD
jgi:putative transposase